MAGRCRFSGFSFICLYKHAKLNEVAALGGRRQSCCLVLGLCLRTNNEKCAEQLSRGVFCGWVLLLHVCSLLLLFFQICLKETLKDLHIVLLRKCAISCLPGDELKLRK